MCKPIFYCLFLVFLYPFTQLYSQNFEGKIADKNNMPVYGSTVFIRESNQGLACNNEGEFQVTLAAGKYKVEYRCLGYESLSEEIIINSGKKTVRNIHLKEKPIELREVVVSNKEDPAYEIMRRAIKKAPHYQNILKEYNAESYIKGNMELVKVNSLIDRMSSDEGTKMSDYKGKLFVQESYNHIKYNAPDKYEQTVNAFSSSIPDNFDSKDAMPLTTSSLYLPRFAMTVSPLNPKALSYYKFRYEGFAEENGDVVNKIKVIPKVKDPELLEGWIYIADNTWDIRYAELSSNMYGIQQNFTITYNKLSEGIYMPTTYSNKANANILGIEGYFNYYASIKYNDFIVNDSIAEYLVLKEKKNKKLEIKREDTFTIKSDSLAMKRDSLYWLNIRNIPLLDKEVVSYEKKDSIQHRLDSIRKNYNNATFEPLDLLTGGRIGGDSAKFVFKYGGIVGALRDYNFVDGWGLGQKFEFSTRFNEKKNRFAIIPEVYYTTARKNIVWKTDLELDYAPMQIGRLRISGGDVSTDFNPQGANRLDNAISSLLFGRNASMLYRMKYVLAQNDIDLANGLRLSTYVKFADRDVLYNNTDYSFFGGKGKIKPNIISPDYSDLASYGISLKYTPRYYYSVYKGRKFYRYATSPTFTLSYSEGFSSWMKDNARFRKLEGSISQELKTNFFGRFDYQVAGGSFLGKTNRMNFADLKHFNTVDDLWLITKSPFSSFMLLDAYEASTNDYWAYSQINYYSKYIFLKRLPFLQGKMFNEAVHLKYLYTPNKKNYTEVGYSVDFFKTLSLGVHCSFDKFKYESFGVRLSFDTKIFD